MAYRGRDLDLRLPGGAGAFASDAASIARQSQSRAAAGPEHHGSFLVDGSVLACFNHAYDIAAAHRAPEVRLPHLLLAATRITETSKALSDRGVYVPEAMRKAASAVASQFPVSNDNAPPRTSDEIEDVLRHAAIYAQKKSHPINADELIDVLFEMKTDVAGIELLDRKLGQAEKKGTTTVRDTPRDRIRMPGTSAQYGARSGYSVPVSNSTTDSIQNTRLDALEDIVRALGADLAHERRSYSESLDDLQYRDVRSEHTQVPYVEVERYPEAAPEPPRSHEYVAPQPTPQPAYDREMLDRIDLLMREISQLNKRIVGLEAQLNNRGDVDIDVAPVMDRIGGLEVVIRDMQKDRNNDVSDITERISDLESLISDRGSVDVDMKPMIDRLDIIEEAVMNAEKGDSAALMSANASLSNELKALDGRVVAQSTRSEQAQKQIVEHINALVADVTAQRSEQAKSQSEFSQSLARVQTLLSEEISRDREDTAEFVQEISQVHEALMKLNTNQHTLAASIENWREVGARDIHLVSSRLDDVVAETKRPVQLLETMSANMEAMYRATVERYHRRNRFWYWLFGTDDWVTASWPSATARIEAERRALQAKITKVT